MRERADQHVRGIAPWRIGQLEPVPLHLHARRMLDVNMRAALHPRARFAMRTQVAFADVTRERLVAAIEAEHDNLVEQHRQPHVRVISEPLPHIHVEPIERIVNSAAATHARDTRALQVLADRLAVMANVTSDRRQRPALLL